MIPTAARPVGAAAGRGGASLPAPEHFPWLDPLRGFAALSVLVYHLVALAALPWPTWYPVAWFRLGFLGVDLFFAISGAVILHSLSRLHASAPQGWRPRFALRRLARIVPLYLLTCLVFVLWIRPGVLARDDAGFVLVAHLVFAQNLFPSTHGAINGPSWTLGVEMQFYLLVLLAGPWLLRLRGSGLLLLGVVAGMGWRWAVWAWSQQLPAGEDHRIVIAATQLPGVFDSFVAGMLAWRWTMARRARGHAASAAPAAIAGLLALLAWALAIACMHWHAGHYWQHPFSVIAIRSIIAVASGLSVLAVLELPSPSRGRGLVRLGGDLSYGIYLWHLIVLLALQAALPDLAPWPFAGLVLGATLVLAGLSWVLVEQPLMRRARALEHRVE